MFRSGFQKWIRLCLTLPLQSLPRYWPVSALPTQRRPPSFIPDEVGLAGLKDQIIEADKFDAIEKAVPTWPAKVRVQWHNGQTIKSKSPLYQAIIATGITADELRTMMVEAEKLEAING